MDAERLEILLSKIFDGNPDSDAINIMEKFMMEPQSIFIIFQLIDKYLNNNTNSIGRTSAILLDRCLKLNYNNFSPSIQEQIKTKLISLVFSIDDHFLEKHLSNILNKCIKDDLETFLMLLPFFDTAFERRKFYIPIFLLSHSISSFNDNSSFIIENKDKFFNYILIGLQSNENDVINESIRFYFKLKQKKLSTENEQHLDIIISLLLRDFSNYSAWEVMNKALSKSLIPSEKVREIINCIYDSEIDQTTLLFLINSFEFLDESQIINVLNLFCQKLISQFLDEYSIDSTLIYELKESLQKHPIKNIYEILKENLADQNILIYCLIIKICPKELLNDIDSFILNINSSINQNDQLLDLFVLNVLYSFQESFNSYDFVAIEFLPRILNLIKHEENFDIAIQTIDLFSECITASIPGLLKKFNVLNDYFHRMDYCQYIDLMFNVITIDNSINSVQINALIDKIILALSDSSFDTISLLDIITKIEDFSDKIVSPELINKLFSKELLYYIDYEFIKKFGSRFKEQFQQLFLSNPHENEYERNFQKTYCMFAKCTNDKQLARKLWDKCLNEIIDGENNQIINSFDSISYIIKLMDRKDLKKLLFNIYIFVNENSSKKIVVEALHPLKKLLRYSNEEDKEFYLNKCKIILDKIIKDLDIFSYGNDFEIMNKVGSFVSEFVIYQSSHIEQVSDFIIKVITSFQILPYIETYIGACCNLFNNKKLSQKVENKIIELIQQMIQFAKYPQLKQKIVSLMISMAQYDSEVFQNITKYVDVLQNWYLDEIKLKCVHKDFLATITLAFLTFFENGMKIESTLLDEVISEFPPQDIKITSSMIQKFINVFKSNKFELPYIQKAAFALAEIFFLSEKQLKKKKISLELIDDAKKLFISFLKSSPEIKKALDEKFIDSKDKIKIIDSILNEQNK